MKKNLFYIVYICSPVLLIYTLYQSNPLKYQSQMLFISMMISAMAYTWVVWQFILSSKPKFIDRLIGLDKLFRVHGLMGIVSIVLITVHRMINTRFWGTSPMSIWGNFAYYILLFVSVSSILFMTNRKYHWIKWILKPIKNLNAFKYEHNLIVHNLSVLSFISIHFHVLMTSNAESNINLLLIYNIYFMIGISFYMYHKLLKPWLLEDKEATVFKVIKETENVVTLSLKPTFEMSYQPGQFAYFNIRTGGNNHAHPFTISSAPNDSDTLAVTIKKMGGFTQSIDQVSLDTKVMIDGPYGRFSYRNFPKEKTTVFVVGGVGITPVMSMLSDMSTYDNMRKVLLLFGMKKTNDFIFKDSFDGIQQLMPNLKIVPVVSDDMNYLGEKGYIDALRLKKYLNELGLSGKDVGFYVCGPPILVQSVRDILYEFKIKSRRVHSELFSF